MVSPLSKLANPWKCDAPGCGQLRAKDTNHWLIVRPRDVLGPISGRDLFPEVTVSPWDETLAEMNLVKHACGVPCGLKIAAALIMETFFPAEISIGKEVVDGN